VPIPRPRDPRPAWLAVCFLGLVDCAGLGPLPARMRPGQSIQPWVF